MKKVAIITFHFPNNVGAILQCTMLQNKLTELGCYVEIINYRPQYLVEMYKPFRIPFTTAYRHVIAYNKKGFINGLYMFIRHIYSVTLSNLDFINVAKRTKQTNAFIQKYIHQTKQYKSLSELKNSPPVADIYICGSDQIWNSDITNGNVDSAYYLDFGNSEIRKIAYGVSADIKTWQYKAVKNLLEKFNAISVREKDSIDILSKVGNYGVELVPDPTLLVTQDVYTKYEVIPNNKNYILFYGLKSKKSKILKEIIKTLQEKTKIKVIDISPYYWNIKSDKRILNIAPGEFLGYIKNSAYIVTNSYHGTIFSLIYHKKFWVTLPSLKSNRIEELLKIVELNDRIVNYSNLSKIAWEKPVDFKRIDYLIAEFRKSGERFLKDNI